MDQTIDIKITCPIKIHNEIEEHCINNGITLSKYLIDLHEKENIFNRERARLVAEEQKEEEQEAPATKKKGGKK